MKRYLVGFMFLIGADIVSAQTTKIVPFTNPDPNVNPQNSIAYQPMPVICVHGILAGRDTWNTTLTNLQAQISQQYAWAMTNPVAQVYSQDILYKPSDPHDLAYAHTFEYGCYGRVSVLNRIGHSQTLDDIRSNAWAGVSRNIDNPTGAANVTLADRIDAVRTAYAVQLPGQPLISPPVILLCHSMGGILAHYYLTQAGDDGSVLRVVTLGTPHYGSDIPELPRYLMDANAGSFRRHSRKGAKNIVSWAKMLSREDAEAATRYAFPSTGNPEKTGLENMTPNGDGNTNELISFFETNSVPGYCELVFNSFRWPTGESAMLGLSSAGYGLSPMPLHMPESGVRRPRLR